ncbi:MAG: hypothetical protein PHS95_03020 [Candidatus Pacebacteria bacterium]|nr:hypothetical protein [Candidatus Paceibacterota bacterium]
MKNITQGLKVVLLAILLSLGLSYVYAWTAPTQTAPSGNVTAPLNTSSTAQSKAGDLTISSNLIAPILKDLNDPANFFVHPKGDSVLADIYLRPNASSTQTGSLYAVGDICSGSTGAGTGKCLSTASSGGGSDYGNGSDNDAHWTTDSAIDPTKIWNYKSIILDATRTLTVSSVNTPLIMRVQGNATINGRINLSSKGAPRGNNGNSPSYTGGDRAGAGGSGSSGTCDPHWGASGSGGGGASMWGAGGNGSNGVNKYQGTTGVGGAGGVVYRYSDSAILALIHLTSIICGGGGGNGGGPGGGVGGNGGGAMLMYVGGNLTLGSSSIIEADGSSGGQGVNVSGCTGAGGGGAGGGTVMIVVAGTVTNNGVTIHAVGGGGGGGDNQCPGGASGGVGKIIIMSIASSTILQS